MSKTKQFDEKIAGMVNQERMGTYGHPLDHFTKTQALANILFSVEKPMESYHKHAMFFILDKLVRLSHTPDHFDSWLDIAGYARTALMAEDKYLDDTQEGLEEETPKGVPYKRGERQAFQKPNEWPHMDSGAEGGL